MKIIMLVFSFYLWMPLASGSDIFLKLSSSYDNTTKLLNPIWDDLQYTIEWNKKELGRVGETVQAQLMNARIQLGKTKSPLFHATTHQSINNFLLLDWKLQHLKLKALIKIRFKFRQYGVKVTHDEYFEISGGNIADAKSQIKVIYQPGTLKLQNIKHHNFSLSNFKVRPKNGVGSILRFIFDNIFSEKKVNQFIKTKINQELQAWINRNEIITEVEESLNKQLYELHNTPWAPQNASWDIYTSIDKLVFKNKFLHLNSSFNFDTSHSNIHMCADAIVKEDNTYGSEDDITLSYKFVERIINSYAIYETYSNGKLQEPIFCFGYKEYDENGNPLGEIANINFLKRQIRFKYWISPTNLPSYIYDHEKDQLTLDLDLIIKINAIGFPKLMAINDHLRTSITATYKFEFQENIGLQMRFINLKINELDGRLKIKWIPYTPWLPLSIKRIKYELEKSLNGDLSRNPITHLLDQEIFLNENMSIQLKDFNFNDKGMNFLISL